MKIAISSGHSTKCQGAIGYLNEVTEATRAVDRIYEIWQDNGIQCWKFHDTISDDSSENLNRITDWHNAQTRDLDVSVHLNAYNSTSKEMGSECLYVTQSSLAATVSAAMAGALGLPNRGAKYRNDLFVLNNTEEPAILLECCFVDSTADAEAWRELFEDFCQATAAAIAGQAMQPPDGEDRPPIERPPAQEEKTVDIQIYAPPGVRVDVSINNEAEGRSRKGE
jgi:N-acetylmuramoyl-L-alanine amidase